MITVIDRAHMIVDLADCAEIVGAESVDLDAGTVTVRERSLDGEETVRTVHVPAGIRIVRRR